MNGWEPSSFPLPRLMSEFGVQSLPSHSTLAEVYKFPEDAGMFSDLNVHRQHHENGNQEIVDEIQNNLHLPNLSDPVENFKSYIYLSQINQAMTLKTGTEVFRRLRSTFDNETGFGNCMGTMYWQFNDLWQAPTWSTIEYVSSKELNTYGFKWKMAHYFIKNAYAKILMSPFINNQANQLEIYAISDIADQTIQSTFSLKVFAYDSFNPVFEQTVSFRIEPLLSKSVYNVSLGDLETFNCFRRSNESSCLIQIDSTDQNIQDGSKNFIFLNNRLTDLANLSKAPKVRITNVRKTRDGLFEISLETDSIALFVWLDIGVNNFFGIFSDNGFHMTSHNYAVTYQTDDFTVTEADISKYLTVKSLTDAYKKPDPFINNASTNDFNLSMFGILFITLYFIQLM